MKQNYAIMRKPVTISQSGSFKLYQMLDRENPLKQLWIKNNIAKVKGAK